MIWLAIPLLALTGCGSAIFATRTKDGRDFTSDVFTAKSNQHKTKQEAEEQIRHVADVYCSAYGGGYEEVDTAPSWDPVDYSKFIHYDNCRSMRKQGAKSCDAYARNEDGYVHRDEKKDECFVMFGCQVATKSEPNGPISGSQRFRCFKK